MSNPVLVACAHGTRGADGRRAVGTLVAAVQAARPGTVVRAAFVDVQEPTVAHVVHEVTDAGSSVVVVPLLLSAGYHVAVDIGRAVHGRAATATPALGPDDRLTALLHDRLLAAGTGDEDALVLAAAGSSDPAAVRDVERVAAALAALHSGPVTVGYAAAAKPSVTEAVETARREHPGRRVVVAAYLLAPGHFHRRLGDVGADVLTAALLSAAGPPDPRLVEIVLDRYDAGVRSLLRD
ncbi:sirohydrochlorin chelatase [Angustibacter luteus]|uniref:Sirohydrochlorin chelatase n=1 Tax=Angustibacter luteus TaxID=658456 RepID=A0ABW1JG26_9ACTN